MKHTLSFMVWAILAILLPLQMAQKYWNDEITLDELVDRLTPRLKLYLDE